MRLQRKACCLSNKEVLEIMHMRMEKQKKDEKKAAEAPASPCPQTPTAKKQKTGSAEGDDYD